MAGFNGSGTFVRSYNWVVDKGNSVKVTASRMDAEDDGFATGLSTAILKDGQQTTTAVIPFAQGLRVSDGSVGTPSISCISDTDSGFYRIGANNFGLALAGALAWDFGTATSSVAGSLAVGGTLAVAGAFTATGLVTGSSANFTATCAAVTHSGTTGSFTGLVSGASANFTATCSAANFVATGSFNGASANFTSTCSAAVINSTGVVNAGSTVQQAGADLIPAGVIVPYGGSSAPTGWLLCDGSSLVRASYAALFTAIGTTYGAADGTHFSVPDLTGRVPAGKESSASRLTSGGGGVDGGTLGAVGGTQTHTLTLAQSAAHDHGGATGTDSPDHTHTIPDTGGNPTGGSLVASTGSGAPRGNITGGASTTHTHSITSAGGGAAHPNVQPTIIVNYIIKT